MKNVTLGFWSFSRFAFWKLANSSSFDAR